MKIILHSNETLEVFPATPGRWPELETLFGARGACGGCWCMHWRLTRREYEARKGEPNRLSLRHLVLSGREPGLLGYLSGQPVGWCALAPREHYGTLQRSRILKPIDAQPVWSVPCFFVKRGARRKGVAGGLLQGAIETARARGAKLLEGYPVDPGKPSVPDLFVFTGLLAIFEELGFEESARRSPTRPVMRLSL